MFGSVRVAVTVQLAGMEVTVLLTWLKYSAFTYEELMAETVIAWLLGVIDRLVQVVACANGMVALMVRPPSLMNGPPSRFKPPASSTMRWQYGSQGLSVHALDVPKPWVC